MKKIYSFLMLIMALLPLSSFALVIAPPNTAGKAIGISTDPLPGSLVDIFKNTTNYLLFIVGGIILLIFLWSIIQILTTKKNKEKQKKRSHYLKDSGILLIVLSIFWFLVSVIIWLTRI